MSNSTPSLKIRLLYKRFLQLSILSDPDFFHPYAPPASLSQEGCGISHKELGNPLADFTSPVSLSRSKGQSPPKPLTDMIGWQKGSPFLKPRVRATRTELWFR